jgi:hypothetical protein
MQNPFSKFTTQEKLQFIEAWKKGDPKARTFFDNYLRKSKRAASGGNGMWRHKSTMSNIEDFLRRQECMAVDGNPWNADYSKFAQKELKQRGLAG